jgi:hypothetical protein
LRDEIFARKVSKILDAELAAYERDGLPRLGKDDRRRTHWPNRDHVAALDSDQETPGGASPRDQLGGLMHHAVTFDELREAP